jgi:hypothetical protein
MYVCMHVCMYVYVCVCVCMYVCMYVLYLYLLVCLSSPVRSGAWLCTTSDIRITCAYLASHELTGGLVTVRALTCFFCSFFADRQGVREPAD